MFSGLNGHGWAAGALGRDWITYGSLYTVAVSQESGSWLGRWILWVEIEFFCRWEEGLWAVKGDVPVGRWESVGNRSVSNGGNDRTEGFPGEDTDWAGCHGAMYDLGRNQGRLAGASVGYRVWVGWDFT